MRLVIDGGQWAEEIKAIEKAFAAECGEATSADAAANATASGTPPPVEVPIAMNDLPEPVPPQRE